MSTPRAVVVWVAFVSVLAGAALALTGLTLDADSADLGVAIILTAGVAMASLLPIRYRIGGSTHAVTVDEPFLVAMLLALPPAWPAFLFAGGVGLANSARRRPAPIPFVRVAFNTGSSALSSAVAAVTYVVLAGDAAPMSAQSLLAATAAMAAHTLVSTAAIAELFRRLQISTLLESVRQVADVSRVTFPVHLVGGLVLGWLATLGAGFATVGVGVVMASFVGYRAAVAVRLQRVRASRLRDVAMALVAASGSMDAFDDALSQIATLFGAKVVELHLLGQAPRWIARDGGSRGAAPGPTRAAGHGLTLDRATSLEAGTDEGGVDGALVAPLRNDDGLVGVLVLHARRGLEPWDDADGDVLDGVASEILVALRNAELVEEIAGERSRLAAQSGLLGGILDAVSDGIAMIGLDGQVLAWNPGMAVVSGVGSPDAVGLPWHDVLDATDEAGNAEAVVRDLAAATGGSTIARTWRITPPAGDPRFTRIVLTPVTDPDRPGVVIVARDVTAAREVDRVKADFIATVSHELRTPLTPLKGFLELADRRDISEDMQKEMRTSMRRQIGRLEILVDDLLAMAELDRDLVDLNQADLALQPILGRLAVAFAEAEAEGRMVVQATDVRVSGDREAVDRIVTALVSNALKHTLGEVRILARPEGSEVLLEVSDEGPGIAIGDQEAIFERFHRLGDHLHRTQGPGLGLPIARALARRLGGDVEVTSSPSTGSTFRLRLPAAVDPGVQSAAG